MQAVSERDLKDEGWEVAESDGRLVEVDYPSTSNKPSQKTVGFKTALGNVLTADRGFDWNAGRSVYKPNLDEYPTPLAHAFAKVEMSGGDFKWAYGKVKTAVDESLAKLGKTKLSSKEMLQVRNQLNREFTFAAGVIDEKNLAKIGTKTKTVWLSDDTLIKQLNSRVGDKYFDVETYAVLPEVINQPDEIIPSEISKHFELTKIIDGKKYRAILKALDKEIFLQSFRLDSK